jgi:CCGSCS motif protein
MFNIFTVAKDQNEQAIEQEKKSTADKQVTAENEKSAPVHGEDGACCGGCGG